MDDGLISLRGSNQHRQTVFLREELSLILSVYGRFVAAGLWRDYKVSLGREEAAFAVYQRTSEVPLYRIIKRPALAKRQGQWLILGSSGQILKRGSNLSALLRFFDGRLLRLVE